jgi:hypothetical protein
MATEELATLDEQGLFNLLRNSGMYDDLVRVSNDEYSANDCWSQEHGVYIELKCRRRHYETLMIEKIKYDRLVDEATKIGMLPLYICSTPEGIWQFNLELLPLKWQEMDNLPATTEFANQERVTKTVAMLPLDLGTPILVWYPEYDSEYDYFNEKLSADYDFNAMLELIDTEVYDEEWEEAMLAPNEGWEDLGGESILEYPHP